MSYHASCLSESNKTRQGLMSEIPKLNADKAGTKHFNLLLQFVHPEGVHACGGVRAHVPRGNKKQRSQFNITIINFIQTICGAKLTEQQFNLTAIHILIRLVGSYSFLLAEAFQVLRCT